MSEELASQWLGELVSETKIAFSTQKQALNALVFFFRDVCGRAEVRLDVRMRKRERRTPVVPSREEVMRLIEKLEGVYKTAAKVQYGSGGRLRELVTLRVRDVDLERGTVTVKGGKGNKDRVTILPEAVKEEVAAQLERCKGLWKADREAGRPGVALPNALARKKPKAGERWEWFWQFPARGEPTDPESGIVRRHHLHEKVYSAALKRAGEAAGLERSITSHCPRHGVRDALAGGVDGLAHDPGIAGSRGTGDHRALHACGGKDERERSEESVGWGLRRLGGRDQAQFPNRFQRAEVREKTGAGRRTGDGGDWDWDLFGNWPVESCRALQGVLRGGGGTHTAPWGLVGSCEGASCLCGG